MLGMKAGDIIRIYQKKGGRPSSKDYTIMGFLSSKEKIIVRTDNYTTTLDMFSIKKRVLQKKIKVGFFRKNEDGGYEDMKGKLKVIKADFIAFFEKHGVNNDSKKKATEEFNVSKSSINRYIGLFGIVSKKEYPELTEEFLLEECLEHGTGERGIRKFADKYGKSENGVMHLIEKYNIRDRVKMKSDMEASCPPSIDIQQEENQPHAVDMMMDSIPNMPDASENNDIPEFTIDDVEKSLTEPHKRLKVKCFSGDFADYKILEKNVIILNKVDPDKPVEVKKDCITDFIMEIDELLSEVEADNTY